MEDTHTIRSREICSVCGLPKDLCVCVEISKEQQRIKIRVEKRKWSKPTTVIEGVDPKSVDLGRLAQKLKELCACGGTAKENLILLQGDHRSKVVDHLTKLGFAQDNIEVQ